MRNWWVGACLVLLLFGWSGGAQAGSLSDRLQQFPDWQGKPQISAAKGDLVYPDWMAGTWTATTTLVEMEAPLAPDIVTPGFKGNRQYRDRPVEFQVRFERRVQPNGHSAVVADRAFNGTNIAKAYLGKDAEISASVDPEDPNRQVMELENGRKLISRVLRRKSELASSDRFVAMEILHQMFGSEGGLYFNEVEVTTAYQRQSPSEITGDRATAVYLSPQDPDYFNANGKPVALYRYRLKLVR